MSRNFQLLQQMSSVEELFETAENPAGLVGTAECEPRPTWSEKPELLETADHRAGLVCPVECEPLTRWQGKPGKKGMITEAPSIHCLSRERTTNMNCSQL